MPMGFTGRFVFIGITVTPAAISDASLSGAIASEAATSYFIGKTFLQFLSLSF
jgi:hypothetical protein